jgi:hypothetical protein
MGRIGGWFCNSRKVGQWGPPVWQWHLIGEWGGPIGQRGNWWTERNRTRSAELLIGNRRKRTIETDPPCNQQLCNPIKISYTF